MQADDTAASGASSNGGVSNEVAAAAPDRATLMIEAKLALGDGSVQVLEVRAADRCKDIAAKFVREHSLKASFEAPLRAYLMAAEKNAEQFPVMLEADLLEIQQDFMAKKVVE